ncbi:MAG: radical SAM protein [Oscillospiraceae bacterium]|jgi:radical SAM protein with 4Fe4S-binding SPASM domain|nr:radical SAM protein [Oscillospiraceae bacterium]
MAYNNDENSSRNRYRNPESKLQYHWDKVQHLLNGEPEKIAPVTIHFAPTLECNHNCYFCTYGEAKKKHCGAVKMSLENAKDYLKKLNDAGVRGIIFTGGGDPCTHEDLIHMMEECNLLGMHFALNTNGGLLSSELSESILKLNPVYVRVSINAGSPKFQRLMAGKDDFDEILTNFKALLMNKVRLNNDVNVSAACVVGEINYLDLKNLADAILKIEKEVEKETGINPQIDIHIRPIYNHKTSKIYDKYDEEFINRVKSILQERENGLQAVESFERFIEENEQTPQAILDKALKIIEDEIKPELKNGNSKINIFYPNERMKTVGVRNKKAYDCCLGLYFYGTVWSDGKLYPCVEYAGIEEYAVGDLNNNTAREILSSEERKKAIARMNERLHECPPVCAYNEMNIYLDNLIKGAEKFSAEKTRGISFI